jgi:hypothetical protein
LTKKPNTVSRGGEQDVVFGGTASGTIVDLASDLVVDSGGLAISTTFVADGLGVVTSGLVNGAVLTSGTELALENGGQVTGAISIASGARVDALGTNATVRADSIPLVNSGSIDVEFNDALTLSGTISNAGTLVASGGILVIDAVVSGGSAVVGDGIVDFTVSSSENVAFQSGGSGGLWLAVASAYTGAVSGFGLGGNHHETIALTAVKSATTVHLAYTPNSSHPTSSGVLTVTSGGHTVASINMVGHYVTSNFHLGAGFGGDVSITDPPVVLEQKPGNAATTISAGEELEIKVPDSGRVTFAAPTGALRIDHAGTFTGKVAGLPRKTAST